MVQATQIAYFNYLGVLLALICGLVLYDEELNSHALVGMTLILVGVYLANSLKPEAKGAAGEL